MPNAVRKNDPNSLTTIESLDASITTPSTKPCSPFSVRRLLCLAKPENGPSSVSTALSRSSGKGPGWIVQGTPTSSPSLKTISLPVPGAFAGGSGLAAERDFIVLSLVQITFQGLRLTPRGSYSSAKHEARAILGYFIRIP